VNNTGYSVFSGSLVLPQASPLNPFNQAVNVTLNESAPALGENYNEAHIDYYSAVLGALLAIGRPAAAQTTNAPAATNATAYSSFQIIVERNIFDPNRYAHTSRGRKRAISKSAPNFSLVGTMNYRNGMIAFFDGNDADYRKVLSPDGVIAGYKVVEITQRGVKLEAAGKPVEMKVGAQMRQENKGEWQLAEPSELSISTTGNETPAANETPGANPRPAASPSSSTRFGS